MKINKVIKPVLLTLIAMVLTITTLNINVNAENVGEVYINEDLNIRVTVNREKVDEQLKLEFTVEHEDNITINDVVNEANQSVKNDYLFTDYVGEDGNYKYTVNYSIMQLLEIENEESIEALRDATFLFTVKVDEFTEVASTEETEATLDYFIPETGEVVSIPESEVQALQITPFATTGRLTVPTDYGEFYIDSYSGGWQNSHYSWGMAYIDGKIAYCLDPTRHADRGNTYTQENFFDQLPPAQQQRIWLISYFGYGFEGDNNAHRYLAAQELIWEQMTIDQVRGYGGDQKFAISWSGSKGENTTTINNYKTTINNLISTYNTRPSFHNTTRDVKVGDTLTFTDTNGVLSRFNVNLPSGLTLVSNSGNTLTVRVTSASVDGQQITLSKKHQPSSDTTTSWGYGDAQKVFTAGRDQHDPLTSVIRFNLASGDLEITKLNEDGVAVSGVRFAVSTNANMSNPIATITTNSNGIARLADIDAGTYYYQEVSVPSPLIIDTTIRSISVTAGSTARTTVTNDIAKGQIQIVKTSEHGDLLQGVRFNVLNASGNTVDTITTNSSGVATSKTLPLGNYTVVEIATLSGMVLDSSPHSVTIAYANQTTPIVVVSESITNNYQKGNVTVSKYENTWDRTFNEYNYISLEGATIALYAKNDIYEGTKLIFSADELIDTKTTNFTGKVTFNNLSIGEYYAKELVAPEGYVLFDGQWDITITYGDPIVSVTESYKAVYNQVIYGKAQLIKTNGDRLLLSDAVFGLYTVDGKLVDEFTTDKNGMITTYDLRYGEYYFQEHKSPYGYWTDLTPIHFSITEHESVEYVTMANALIEIHLEWKKVDEDNLPLEGVGFSIRDLDTGEFVTLSHADGKEVIEQSIWYTDANGEVFTKGMITAGNYELVEVAPLDGFKEIAPIRFTIDEDQNYVNLGSLIGFSLELGEIVNYWNRGDLVIMKVDIETGEPLAEFGFNLYDWNNELIGYFETDENGIIVIEDLRYGIYTIEEIKVGSDYGLDPNNNTQTIFIEEDGIEYSVTFENKRADIKTTASFYERDKETPDFVTLVDVVSYTDLIVGKEYRLEGTLMDKETGQAIVIDGELIKGYTTFTPTEKDGTVEVYFTFDQSKLETKTIVVFEDLYRDEIHVVAHHDLEDIDQTIEVLKVQLKKVDERTGQYLTDAEFTRWDIDGNIVEVKVVNEEGIVEFMLFESEYARFKETNAPAGYKLSDEEIEIIGSKDIDGNLYVIEYKNTRLPDDALPTTGDSNMMNNFAYLLIGLGLFIVLLKNKKKGLAKLTAVVSTAVIYTSLSVAPAHADAISDMEGIWNKSKNGMGRGFNLVLSIVSTIGSALVIIILIIKTIQFLALRKNGEDTSAILTTIIGLLIALAVLGVMATFSFVTYFS